MMEEAPEDILLTYRGVSITRADFGSVNHPGWYTRNVVEFYGEHLRATIVNESSTPQLCLIGPKFGKKFVLSANRQSRSLSSEPTASDYVVAILGPTYWSLVVIDVKRRIPFHYQSPMESERMAIEGNNAEDFISKYSSLYGWKLQPVRPMPAPPAESECDGGPVLQRVLAILIKRLMRDGDAANMCVLNACKNFDARSQRMEILGLLEHQLSLATVE